METATADGVVQWVSPRPPGAAGGPSTPLTPPLTPQVHPLFATIYNSIHFLAKAVEATRQNGRWVMGTSVAEHARDFQLEGFCQPFSVTEDGDVSVPYVVLDTDSKGDQLWPVYGLEPGTRGLSYRSHSIHWPHSSSPGTDAGCWFESGSICNGGERAPPWSFPHLCPSVQPPHG